MRHFNKHPETIQISSTNRKKNYNKEKLPNIEKKLCRSRLRERELEIAFFFLFFFGRERES